MGLVKNDHLILHNNKNLFIPSNQYPMLHDLIDLKSNCREEERVVDKEEIDEKHNKDILLYYQLFWASPRYPDWLARWLCLLTITRISLRRFCSFSLLWNRHPCFPREWLRWRNRHWSDIWASVGRRRTDGFTHKERRPPRILHRVSLDQSLWRNSFNTWASWECVREQ